MPVHNLKGHTALLFHAGCELPMGLPKHWLSAMLHIMHLEALHIAKCLAQNVLVRSHKPLESQQIMVLSKPEAGLTI